MYFYLRIISRKTRQAYLNLFHQFLHSLYTPKKAVERPTVSEIQKSIVPGMVGSNHGHTF